MKDNRSIAEIAFSVGVLSIILSIAWIRYSTRVSAHHLTKASEYGLTNLINLSKRLNSNRKTEDERTKYGTGTDKPEG